jgi:translation initiation factor IF-2
MKNGMVVTPNDSLDFDTVALVAPDFGFEVENVAKSSAEIVQDVSFGDLKAERVSRPPVVTVMGHVDHGKTSLLDAIRKADVASGEAGGITQHVGAYKVTLEDNSVVTFIDTPGHEAFTAMRARGANVTDIVVLVVAADDGVMHQTIEAISHAKAAGVPIIVAVNKIDRPAANVAKIKQQLTEYELVAEEWGGTTIFCEVSALKKTGVKELLEQLHVQAEVMELKANPKRSGTGVVLESRLERGRGVVATLLIKDGSVRLGQNICAGATYGRVRALFSDRGQTIKEAGPSEPVEVLGLNAAPRAGDTFDICVDEAAAESLAQKRQEELSSKTPDGTGSPKAKVTLEELFSKVQTGDVKELPIILKSDVAGSGEALKAMLEKTTSEKVKVRVIHSAVGGVTESDVLLASSSKGLIIGFNVRPEPGASALAKSQGVEIKAYSIIYEVIDDVKKAMGGLLAPTIVEKTLGHAEVRNVFAIPKIGTIAGCSVLDGKIFRTSLVRLLRDSRVVYEGKVSSLKRFKDDVKEVATGYECGIAIENYNDLKVGDVIEAFEKQSVATEL